jgi:E3 ubiquitin-protein ligase DRIP
MQQVPFCFSFRLVTTEVCLQVEILCGGKPVSPGITLHDLADYWIDKRPKGRVRSSVGTPAAEFVLKVFYARSGVSLPETENNKD